MGLITGYFPGDRENNLFRATSRCGQLPAGQGPVSNSCRKGEGRVLTLARHVGKRISRIRALRLAAGVLSAELSTTTHDRGMLLQTIRTVCQTVRRSFTGARAGRFRRHGAEGGAAYHPRSPETAADTDLQKTRKVVKKVHLYYKKAPGGRSFPPGALDISIWQYKNPLYLMNRTVGK